MNRITSAVKSFFEHPWVQRTMYITSGTLVQGFAAGVLLEAALKEPINGNWVIFCLGSGAFLHTAVVNRNRGSGF